VLLKLVEIEDKVANENFKETCDKDNRVHQLKKYFVKIRHTVNFNLLLLYTID
jgi:hypothetical protein